MKDFVRFYIYVVIVGFCLFPVIGLGAKDDSVLDAEFDDSSSLDAEFGDQTQTTPTHDEPPAPSIGKNKNDLEGDSLDLDAEFEALSDDKPAPELIPEPVAQPKPAPEPVPEPVAQPSPVPEPVPEPVAQPSPVPEPVPEPVTQSKPVTEPEFKVAIKSMKYRPNDNGGTIVIEGDGPLSYSSRKNQETGQFIVEIPTAKLPSKLKRPLVTKDIGGPYGAIDAYQNEGSTTARIVIQLRKGSSDPILQTEGNSVLVVGQMALNTESIGEETVLGEGKEPSKSATEVSDKMKPLDANTLADFLIANKKFYGEKKSFETVDMDLREFFYKYMAEWSGLNIYFDDSIKQTLTIKITEVPWDQALVDILKWKKLGYIRIGDNGLRIASQGDISKEIDDVKKIMDSKKELDPLITKKYYLSYVDVGEESGRITKYISKRGVINSNAQAGIMVVSETEEIHRKIELQIRHDDVPPRQVLIEGKIVEVNEKFTRSFGINWGLSGKDFKSGKQTGNINMDFGTGLANSTMKSSFRMGTFDVIGELSASLALFESEGNAKIISSPRIVTMNKMAANIVQNSSIPYTDGQATAVAGSSTTAMVPKTSFKEVTMNLNVTPQITYEGSIIMAVDFKRDFVPEATNVGSAPSVESRSTHTNIIVKNGQTAVIAGIYQSDMADGSQRVPWISQVPVIGWLFKSSNKLTAKNELMVFITPKILGEFVPNESEPKIEGKSSEDKSLEDEL